MQKRSLHQFEAETGAQRLVIDLYKQFNQQPLTIYGVPRGGIPVSYLVKALKIDQLPSITITVNPKLADVFVDDIIDSGKTREKYRQSYPEKPFYALADYLDKPRKAGEWLIFPWEQQSEEVETSGEDIILRLLQYIGEDPNREGLKETPSRVLKAWGKWASGYKVDVASLFKTFEDGGEKYNQMIVVKDLPYYTFCEHHLAPFFGTATIAYIPNERVVGLSKLPRVLDAFARRLQVQERLTTQVADAIDEHLKPKGVGVLLKGRHLCMESRGICQQGHHTITSALRGEFLNDPAVRAEFLSLAR